MASEVTFSDVRGSAAQVARLAHSRLPVAAFYREFLDALPSPPGTLGAVAWVCGDDSFSKLAVSSRSLASGIQLPYSSDEHARQLQEVRVSRQAKIFYPPAQADYQIVVENALPSLAVFPILVSESVPVVVEVFLPPDLAQEAIQAFVRHAEILCEVAGTFHSNQDAARMDGTPAAHLGLAIYRTLRVTDTCFAIANEGRHAIGCDRVSVLTRRGESYVTRAVSSQESVNRRANVVHALERLVARVLKTGEPFWYPREQAVPPQIQDALEQFVEVSHSRHLGVLPLGERPTGDEETGAEPLDERSPRPVGAMVVEQFTDVDIGRGAIEHRAVAVAEASSIALQNATDHERIFLLPFWRAVSDAVQMVRDRQRWKALSFAAALVAAILLLTFIPTQLKIGCDGELQPVHRQRLFAQIDGTVDRLHVKHGSKVPSGALLLSMRNNDLELARQQTLGEIRKAQSRLHAVRARRFATGGPDSNETSGDEHAAAAEEEDIKALLDSLQKQLAIQDQRRQLLQVTSPVDGDIVTYDLEDRLQDRPVQRGQLLLEVADLDGPWCLELNLPDRRVAHVLRAQEQATRPLPVTFIVASQPGNTYRGDVTEIARATRVDPDIGQNLLVTVAVPADQVAFRQPGTAVQAKIQCGQRSSGYVWLHGVWEFIQSEILFRFF